MATKIKEPVRIREKKLRNGNTSLYLAIYVDGKREYEFLKLYLRPENTKQDKAINRETLALANAIKAQRVIDIQQGRFGFRATKSKVPLSEYMAQLAHKSKSDGNLRTWMSCIKRIKAYNQGDIMISDITTNWVRGFSEYLQTAPKDRLTLKTNTANMYFSKLKTALKQARIDGLINDDIALGVKAPPKGETNREYLTLDEIKKLAVTECRHSEIKRAFLFSCLTGLRRSDIVKLTWGEISQHDGRTRIIFRQKKTGGMEYLDITQQAAELIGERGKAKPDDTVFGYIHYMYSTNANLREWCLRAGIDKHITFHSGRHTFAVLMLSLGTEIYTVSKLLGHRNLATTQIYAKIVDKKKQEAVDKIPRIL